MPQSLPKKALEIYEAALASAKKQDLSEERAHKVAWGAVKRAGFSKVPDTGKWHKMHLASLHITKAALGKDGVMRWAATVSKFAPDVQGDEITPAFFKFAKAQIDSGHRPSPVLCISHIDNGKPDDSWVAGDITDLYIDGERPKSKGTFRDTPLGKAAFEAVRADWKTGAAVDKRVRVSLGFYDEGSEPLRTQKSDGTEIFGRRFSKGWIKHLALTRVPVVEETEIKVMEAKMASKTKREDAASIVGEELADELTRADKAERADKSELDDDGLILKAEDEEPIKTKQAEGPFQCECLDCGHKMESDAHCADIKCPECGGAMRRAERPGPGKKDEEKAEVTEGLVKATTSDRQNQILGLLGQLTNLLKSEWTVDTEIANAAATGNKGTNPPRATTAEKAQVLLLDQDDTGGEFVQFATVKKAKITTAENIATQPPTPPESVQVAAFVDDFATRIKATLLSEGDRRDKYSTLQRHLDAFGEGVAAFVQEGTPPSGRDIADVVSEAVRAAVEPVRNELAGVKAELATLQEKAVLGTAEPPAPQPRSLDTKARVISQPNIPLVNKRWTAQELAWASTGPGY